MCVIVVLCTGDRLKEGTGGESDDDADSVLYIAADNITTSSIGGQIREDRVRRMRRLLCAAFMQPADSSSAVAFQWCSKLAEDSNTSAASGKSKGAPMAHALKTY